MKRTLFASAVLAVATSVPFYWWVTTDTRAEQAALARAAHESQYRAALEAARGATGVQALEAQGLLNRLTRPAGVITLSDKALVHQVANVAGVPLVTRHDTPMRYADEDLWLLREGYVSQRSLERRVVAILLATYAKPELCPVAIRTAPLPIDERLKTSLITDTTPLEPLCRRERQMRLAEEQLQQPLPFSAGLFLHPADRTLKGTGKAAMLVQGMQAADDLWDPKALGETIAVLLAQLAYEDALIVLAKDLQASPTLQTITQRLHADPHETCALSVALEHSLDPGRFVAELVDSYAQEHWPPEPRRSAGLALLYALSEVDVPKEGAAAPARLAQLLDVKPKSLCAFDAPPITRAISRDLLEHLTSSLDRTYYIR